MKNFLYIIATFSFINLSMAEEQKASTIALFSNSKIPQEKLRLGMEIDGKILRSGNLGDSSNKRNKIVIKQWGELKAEPYLALEGKKFELKLKTGLNFIGHMANNDAFPFEQGTKNEGAYGISGGIAFEGKDNRIKFEGKVTQIIGFINTKLQRIFLGMGGACTSPKKEGLKLQFCGNAYIAKKIYEGDKGLEISAEVLLQKQDEEGARIFLAGRLAREKFDSNSPDIYSASVILGGNFDLNPGAIRASRKR